MRKLLAAVAFAAVCSRAGAEPTTIHYWNFNTGFASGAWPASVPASIDAPGVGAGVMTHNFTAADDQGGTTLLAEGADPAGASFTGVGSANNGAALVFSVPTTGWNAVSVQWAALGSSTGFRTMALEYSLDGTAFTALETTTVSPTVYTQADADLSSVAGTGGNADLKLRLIWDGATSGSGTARLDNFKVTGGAAHGPTPVEVSGFRIE